MCHVEFCAASTQYLVIVCSNARATLQAAVNRHLPMESNNPRTYHIALQARMVVI